MFLATCIHVCSKAGKGQERGHLLACALGFDVGLRLLDLVVLYMRPALVYCKPGH